mmetsp:Transcript_12098/g.32724  ORF Transcript_12098/g.32724 Transcript_12098/m.32724 type:complete len:202 (+) Transcript_12098:481-1086(+)
MERHWISVNRPRCRDSDDGSTRHYRRDAHLLLHRAVVYSRPGRTHDWSLPSQSGDGMRRSRQLFDQFEVRPRIGASAHARGLPRGWLCDAYGGQVELGSFQRLSPAASQGLRDLFGLQRRRGDVLQPPRVRHLPGVQQQLLRFWCGPPSALNPADLSRRAGCPLNPRLSHRLTLCILLCFPPHLSVLRLRSRCPLRGLPRW